MKPLNQPEPDGVDDLMVFLEQVVKGSQPMKLYQSEVDAVGKALRLHVVDGQVDIRPEFTFDEWTELQDAWFRVFQDAVSEKVSHPSKTHERVEVYTQIRKYCEMAIHNYGPIAKKAISDSLSNQPYKPGLATRLWRACKGGIR